MRVQTAAFGTVFWYPTLAAAVAEHRPEQIEWCIPGVASGPRPAEGEAARIQAFPTPVSVDRGIVRRRSSPSAPLGTPCCYFIGEQGEINLGCVHQIAKTDNSEGADEPVAVEAA